MTGIGGGLLAGLNVPQSTKLIATNVTQIFKVYKFKSNVLPSHIPTAGHYLVIVKESATAEIAGVAR